jgi:hypothetical protein
MRRSRRIVEHVVVRYDRGIDGPTIDVEIVAVRTRARLPYRAAAKEAQTEAIFGKRQVSASVVHQWCGNWQIGKPELRPYGMSAVRVVREVK